MLVWLCCATTGGEMLLYLMNKDGTSKAGGGRVGDPLNRPTAIPEIPTGCAQQTSRGSLVSPANRFI